MWIYKVSTKTINLKWYQNKHGKGITFISDNRCKFSSKQAKVCVDYKIKSKLHKIFSWELNYIKLVIIRIDLYEVPLKVL